MEALADQAQVRNDGPRRGSRRSLIALSAVAAGMAAVLTVPGLDGAPGALWFAIAGLAGALAGLTRQRVCAGLMIVSVGMIGAGVAAVRVHRAGGMTLDRALAVDDPAIGWRLVRVEGVVVGPVERWSGWRGALARFVRTRDAWFVPMRVDRVWDDASGSWVDARGRVRLAVGEAVEVAAGDRVVVRGRFRPIRPAMNPGQTDPRRWAAQRGEAGSIGVPRASLVGLVRGERGLVSRAWWWVVGGVDRVRSRAGAMLGAGDERDAGRGLLRALVLGQREVAMEPVRASFARVGLAHVLAISGFHIAVLAGMLVLVVRLLGERGGLGGLLVAVVLAGYLVVVPAHTPVVRAGVMVLALVGVEATGRRYDRLAVLGWIGVGLLVWRPMDVLGMGLQLSFGLTAALLWLMGPIADRVRGVRGGVAFGAGGVGVRPRMGVWRWIGGRARVLVLASALCWTLALPIVLGRIGVVSPLAVVLTVAVVPVVVVLLWGGYLALAIGLVLPGVSSAMGRVLGVVGDGVVAVVRAAEGTPGMVVRVPAVPWAWSACAAGVVVAGWWVWAHRDGLAQRGRRWRWGVGIAGVVVAAWGVWAMRAHGRLDSDVAVRIDMLAVGDGSCLIVRAGGGEAVLWDCGSSRADVGVALVPRAARALGVHRVRTAVVTHANLDHFVGLLDAAGPLGIERVLVGGLFVDAARDEPGGAEAALLAGLETRGIAVVRVAAGDVIGLGHTRAGGAIELRFVSPRAGWTPGRVNDASLVAVVVADGLRAAVLTGDVQDEAIGRLLEQPDLGAPVLELPHHGSYRASAGGLVGRVDPRAVLQSTGAGRVDDGRWASAMRGRWRGLTAIDGAVWAEVRTDSSVRTGRFRGR